MRDIQGMVFAVDEMATHDGPGLRMTVYLKGCPLRCVWCHSPESISPRPEVVWYPTRCIQCGKCAEVCPEGLRSFLPLDPKDRSGCLLCQLCVDACSQGALEVKGGIVSAGEIADYAGQLIPFFRRSGGGVTLTGGEPTLQDDFTIAILTLCRHADIHTAVETCGFAPWDKLERIARVTNLFLFDLKHPDEKLHRRYTGVSGKPIIENLARLASLDAALIVRVPLIPGCNDSPATVRAIGRRSAEVGVRRISLLPFNPASAGKYVWLHRPYPLGDLKTQSDAYVAALEGMLRDDGLEVIPRPRVC